MRQRKWFLIVVLWSALCRNSPAQAGHLQGALPGPQALPASMQQGAADPMPGLAPVREKHALQVLRKIVESNVISATEAMPADKFGFVPSDGEFKGVRSFGQMVKHLSATNHILAAAALGEEPPPDAGDEKGPETVRTKAEIMAYLASSFTHLEKAIDAVGEQNLKVKSSPISPLKESGVTRLALTVEALIHAYDHYGQMVEYLRMNGVVPPASR